MAIPLVYKLLGQYVYKETWEPSLVDGVMWGTAGQVNIINTYDNKQK